MRRALTYVVPPEDDGRALKHILRARLHLSTHQLAVLKAQEGILLDGLPARVDVRARAGQALTVQLPEPDAPSAVAAQDAPVDVVYEDEDIIIVNKDAPLACQSSSRQPANTLENRLMFRYLGENYVFRPVNRLDKGTSGLMAVAKHAYAQSILQRQLHTPDFRREYLAILAGAPAQACGVVDAPIAKCPEATVRREVSETGKPSRTRYETLRAAGGLSLVRLRLETGRTHQIRVHMAHIGCPVLGDFLYGQEDARLPGRFALHSAHLQLTHPTTGRILRLDAPLPEALAALLAGA